jgi:wobble nucleotide-excising tRNase
LIDKIQLLRNVGQFDSVNAAQFELLKLTLIYAENGRGKTTLAAVLRSARTGEPSSILERHRLGALHPPHIVLRDQMGIIAFQDGAWSRTLPDVVVFDDQFVSENVCSGMELETEHRQNLHELILGAQGITLNAELQGHVDAVEQHNKNLKGLQDAIPAAVRGRFTVDAFCALDARADIDEAIQEAERSLAAAKSADVVRTRPTLSAIDLPVFNAASLNGLLQCSLPELEAGAAARVQAHLKQLGAGGESWVAEGIPRVAGDTCPFCAQDLSKSPVIGHYQAYFSEAYAALKTAIADQGKAIIAVHGGDIPAAFERDVRVAVQTHEFWAAFTAVPAIDLDTAEVARAWKAARDGVLAAVRTKDVAPLERLTLPADVVAAIKAFHRQRDAVTAISAALQKCNAPIELVREQAASANVATLQADLATLRAVETRHSPAISAACSAYIEEKARKTATENNRDEARANLDRYRTVIFPAYQTATNQYLRRLGAGFRLDSVSSVNNRGGSSCTYSVVINEVPVSVTAATGPSFRNTLSAGDRNTLALAFFFASLDQEANLNDKIIVVDDPMSSLDEHRSRNTLHEILQLLDRVSQMFVLSHSKSFLCALWQDGPRGQGTALRIDRTRDGQNRDASTTATWNVHADCISENDRRHEMVLGFVQSANPAIEREVAAALRPILEAFMRVAYSTVFPPGTLLGPFLNACQHRLGTTQEILNEADIEELRRLVDYGNGFHHDSNPAYQTVLINSHELTDFCQRTLAFAWRA